jgi:hypothetical protein
MATQKRLESRGWANPDVTSALGIAGLPAVVSAERRNWAGRYALLRRVHREFQEMPGLSVTPNQAARLFGLRLDVAMRVLERLTVIQVLRQKRDGQFVRCLQDS